MLWFIIIIFLHGLGDLTCSDINALPSFPGASTISSSLRFVVEGVFRESGVVHTFKLGDPVLFVFESHVLNVMIISWIHDDVEEVFWYLKRLRKTMCNFIQDSFWTKIWNRNVPRHSGRQQHAVTGAQWCTEEGGDGGLGGSNPPPEIPKALQNRAKLNLTVKTVKNCWI